MTMFFNPCDFRLSGCLITEDGCAALAHALSCNPSHLKELDLSYNHVGELGRTQLMAVLEDRCTQLTLRYDNRGHSFSRNLHLKAAFP